MTLNVSKGDLPEPKGQEGFLNGKGRRAEVGEHSSEGTGGPKSSGSCWSPGAHVPIHTCPRPGLGLTLCPFPAQVLLLEAAERPLGPDNDLPTPQSTPPPWNEDFLPDALPLAHPGPQRRRPTGPAGE